MTSEPLYDVIFRGDIAQGESLAAVRQRLGGLFRLNEEQLVQLFSGRPAVLKRGLDQVAATRFRLRLEESGALVQLRPAVGAEQPVMADSLRAEDAASLPAESSSSAAGALSVGDVPLTQGFSAISDSRALAVAPSGADLLHPHERRTVESLTLSLDKLSVAEFGSDILSPEERSHIEPRELDLSHLSVMPIANEGQ